MAANEYLVPFGVDPRKFFEGLTAMDEGTDKLAANVTEANKEMQKAFDGAATAGDKLGKTLDMDTQKALGLKETAKTVGKELGSALDGKNVGAGLEERVAKVKKTLEGVGGNKGVKINFDFNEERLKYFEELIGSGADEVKILGEVVDYAKQKLATLDPNSEGFAELAQQVQTAEEFLTQFGAAGDEVTNKQKTLKAELREIKTELAALELAGEGNTDKFREMAARAGELEDQIGDVSARVRVLASDTKYVDAGIEAVTGLAGAFTAAQGAAALFGGENEEVNKVIQKVTGAMAILQGIQAVMNVLNKDSALSVLLFSRSQVTATASTVALTGAEVAQTGATVGATTAFRAFTAALLANPIFLAVAAIAAVVTALIAFAGGSDDAEEAADKLNSTLERQNVLLGLDEAQLNRRTNLLISETKLKAEQALANAKTDKERLKITQDTETELTKIEGRALASRANLLADNNNELVRLLNDRNYTEKLSAEDYKKLQDEQLKVSEQYKDAVNSVDVKRNELAAQTTRQAADLRKQGNDDAKKAYDKSVADAKEAAEKRKQIVEQEIKFRREVAGAYIDAIEDAYEKEKQAAIKNVNDKIEDLQREKSLSVKAEADKNELIKTLRQNLSTTLADIDRKRENDRAVLLFEGQQKLVELQKEGVDRELELNKLSFKERKKQINEQFKNEGELRVKLLEALEKQNVASAKKIRDDAANQSLKAEEERAILEVETAARFINILPNIEEEKQIAVLEVKLKYAQRNMDLLLSQGNAENSTVVLQAKKQVQELQSALQTATADLESKGGGFSLFKLLGLDNLTDDQKAAVAAAAQTALDSLRQITDAIVDQYQRQIDAKQESIDQQTEDIDRLEDQLEEEQELRDQGFANSVDTLQAEIEEKKRQRDEDIKQQEELIKKQKNVQRLQLAIDTATQASSLITAGANIFKTLSSIPFVGVPLAIATIALMTGAFIAAKVKAFQAVNDGNKQSFGGGGWVNGKPHTQGGKKYRAEDGSGDVVELEGGEHVTKRSQAEKYADLLDAINNDDIGGMTEDALRAMLEEMGIHLTPDPTEAVQTVRERDILKTEFVFLPGQDISDDVKELNENVSFLAERKRNEVEHWTDGEYSYTKRGNKTTRIKIS